MRVVSHPEADQELEAAALWYEERQSGLGDIFLDEFESTLARILNRPDRWRKIRGENRKLNFHRFPYAIVYSIHGDSSSDAFAAPAILLEGSGLVRFCLTRCLTGRGFYLGWPTQGVALG